MFARELLPSLGALQAQAITGSMAQTFTTAGTTQATATQVTTVYTYITTASEGQGAILPPSMNPSDSCSICNSTSVDVYVYPPVGYKLNGGTANVPFMLAPNSTRSFVCVDGNNWMVDK